MQEDQGSRVVRRSSAVACVACFAHRWARDNHRGEVISAPKILRVAQRSQPHTRGAAIPAARHASAALGFYTWYFARVLSSARVRESTAQSACLWAATMARCCGCTRAGAKAACHRGLGLLMMGLSGVLFSTIGLFVSTLGPRYSSFQIVTTRFIGQALTTWLFMATTRTSCRVRKQHYVPMFLRGFLGSSAMMLFYAAVTHMPLAEANVILFTNPVMTLVLGYFVRRRVARRAHMITHVRLRHPARRFRRRFADPPREVWVAGRSGGAAELGWCRVGGAPRGLVRR